MRPPEGLLSELVAATDPDDVPEAACCAVVRQAVDCLGVTLAAASQPFGRIITHVAGGLASTPQARIVGSSVGASVADAAWANGSLAHLLDFDDTGFSHPTACLLPVALALGEHTKASGREAVVALALGYEVFERLASCGRSHEPVLYRRGYHPTSIWGCPAAAAVAGKLLGLDERQVTVALGIAAGSSSGFTQQFGTPAKGLNAGNAARAGVVAALLAGAGYAGDKAGVSGPYGLFAAVFGDGNYTFAGLADELGTRWSIADPGLNVKPYPACTSTLRAVDAMVMIASADDYDPRKVTAITVDVHPELLHTLRFRSPIEGFPGKFSLDYTVAAAALDGTVTLESFSDAYATDSRLRAMLAKVELREHPEWDIARRRDTPVEVTLAGGEVRREFVAAQRGSRAWPMTDDEIATKYVACASETLPEAQTHRSLAAVRRLAEVDSVREILNTVVPREGA